MRKNFLFFLLFFCFIKFYSQSVSGIVVNENQIALPGVLVVNIDNDLKTFTDENGHFVITANSGNELRFVRQNYDRASAFITSASYLFGLNVIMVFAPTDIEEVKLYPKLSGDLSKDSKSLTSEDKLAQLSRDLGLPKAPEKMREKPSETVKNVLVPILVGQLNVQALYNVVSGKARRQKRLYKYNDFQEKIEWLKSNVNPDFFKENNINDSEISEFLSFALLKSNDLSTSFKTKNNSKAEFILVGFVSEYLKRSK